MDGNSEQLQVINLKQLPIIEERLRDVNLWTLSPVWPRRPRMAAASWKRW